jgi:hypothetical protein
MVSAGWPQRLFAVVTISLAACLFGEAGRAEPFLAGSFSFSDELGGFRILSVSGSGSPTDPVVLEEEIFDTGPVVLVIRRTTPDNGPVDRRFTETSRALTLIKVVRNGTRRIWAGFDLELQEVLGKPSIYSDGLSFNQIGASPPDVASDDFARNVRLFEPYDRIRFHSGHVNPETTARIRVHITDPTPEQIFYLLQDPQILFAFLMR